MSALDPKFEGGFAPRVIDALTEHGASAVQDGGEAATNIVETIVNIFLGFFGG